MTNNAVNVTLGERIRRARHFAGYRRAQDLADVVGCHRNTIGHAENDQHVPHPIILKAIAEACGVTVSWLQTGSDEVVTASRWMHDEAA